MTKQDWHAEWLETGLTVEKWYERLRRERQEVEAVASKLEGEAKHEMAEGNPRGAQVYATLAVSSRLDALNHTIREVAPD